MLYGPVTVLSLMWFVFFVRIFPQKLHEKEIASQFSNRKLNHGDKQLV